jgi:hypothetical protein
MLTRISLSLLGFVALSTCASAALTYTTSGGTAAPAAPSTISLGGASSVAVYCSSNHSFGISGGVIGQVVSVTYFYTLQSNNALGGIPTTIASEGPISVSVTLVKGGTYTRPNKLLAGTVNLGTGTYNITGNTILWTGSSSSGPPVSQTGNGVQITVVP